MQPYYDDGTVTIYHGDCLEILPTLPLADLIVTSPPYNLGITTGGGFRYGNYNGQWRMAASAAGIGNGYGTHDDAMPSGAYEDWQRNALRTCWAQLTERGAIFYNHKPRVQAGELWLPLALNPGLPLRQIIVWARAGGLNFAPTHYVSTCEWIMVLAKSGFRLKNQGASGIGDVWRIVQEPSDHPAPFPLGIPGRAIETTAPALVIDPFAGSGTTLRAAKDLGCRSIGIEIEERYCEMAARRMGQEVFDLRVAFDEGER